MNKNGTASNNNNEQQTRKSIIINQVAVCQQQQQTASKSASTSASSSVSAEIIRMRKKSYPKEHDVKWTTTTHKNYERHYRWHKEKKKTNHVEDRKRSLSLCVRVRVSISIADSTIHIHTNIHNVWYTFLFRSYKPIAIACDRGRENEMKATSLKYCYKLWFMNINAYIFYRWYPLKYCSSISCISST